MAPPRRFHDERERAAREGGERSAPMDAEHLLPHPAGDRVLEADVGQRRERHAEARDEVGVADDPVPEARSPLLHDRCARSVVRLGNQDAGGARPRADPAAGAEVDGVIRGIAADARLAEALRLRTDVLWAREVIGHARDRADRRAHVALDAGVGAEGREVARRGIVEGHAATARFDTSDAAARCALASATPSPHRSSR